MLTEGFGAALPGLLSNMTERTGLILIGLRLAGVKEFRVIPAAILAALIVELGVLSFVGRELQEAKRAAALEEHGFPALVAPIGPTP